MNPIYPDDRSSSQEKEINRLEQQFRQALKEGEVFEVLKEIRVKIRHLKSVKPELDKELS